MEHTQVDQASVSTAATHGDRRARIFVWAVWLVMILFALGCIVKYGRNIPLAEDWTLVAPLTGNEPDLASWLWSQNNEHRLPLPRLMLLGLLKLTGDFRAGMVFNVITLGVVAAFTIRVARHLRGGRTDYADAFFPIALLHMGNWENLLWSWQLSFVVPTALIFALLLVMVTHPTLATSGAAVLSGVSLVLLPLCGAVGLVFALFLAPWLIYWGVRHWRTSKTNGGRRWSSGFLMGTAAIALALVGLYFVGYQRPYWNPPSPGLGATLKTAAMFVALGFGPVASKFWAPFVMAAFGLLVPSAGVAVLAVLRYQGWERYRALGVLLFFGILAIFSLAMGYGRSGLVPTAGMPMRYVLFAVPTFCTAFFIWELYGQPRYKILVQRGLLIVMCLLIPLNTAAGIIIWGNWYQQGMNAVERDWLAGTPASILAQRHRDFLVHWWDEKQLAEAIQMLHDAEIGLFAQR
ncbi:hypothetical protein [Coleofasciculus sp. E2-BRE-01]|uniref:hypothetical protein n=1 Tax=Coleofasciculus sp. E2-BRE-01 TaxID=3069524 RepID=UPI0032F17AC2